ncbi:MAG: hypothetical protein PWR01_1936 [Clostridiales bacterium]|jgi:Skp family chaperone for outer membrane proteins|nr:hypothetical protein [Clostridiales bacterium]MDN5280863.1 hypothetical protein [Candidatus Ozemobacter sp.]
MKNIYRLITIFICLSLAFSAQGAVRKIGKVNLGLAVSLHPQMSLFDFDRMGFFKIAPGLSEEEFINELNKLKNAPVSQEFARQEAELQKSLAELDRKKAALMDKMVGITLEEGQKLEKQLNQVSIESEQLRKKLSDIEYQRLCPDLTSPKETRETLNKIEKEVVSELKKLAEEKGYELVLNSSITMPFNFPVKYSSGELYGLGVPGIDFSLFYSFLANKDHILPGDEMPESRKLVNWLELINSPDALSMLPLKPYPLVLHGGEDFTSDLIRTVYKNHKIDQRVLQAVMAVLDTLKQHEKNFDSNIESLIGPK